MTIVKEGAFTGFTWPQDMLPEVRTKWRVFYANAWREYGVTAVFYRQMYLAQSGRCYICRTAKGVHPDDPKGRGGRRLGVDHNHLIGNRIEAVRGLLCTGSLSANTCNRLIAHYSAEQLERAVLHLTDPPAQQLRKLMNMANWSDDQITGTLVR